MLYVLCLVYVIYVLCLVCYIRIVFSVCYICFVFSVCYICIVFSVCYICFVECMLYMYCVLPYFKILCSWPDDGHTRSKRLNFSKRNNMVVFDDIVNNLFLNVAYTQRDVSLHH